MANIAVISQRGEISIIPASFASRTQITGRQLTLMARCREGTGLGSLFHTQWHHAFPQQGNKKGDER